MSALLLSRDKSRALGDRLTAISNQEAVRAITAVYLLLPQIPMLFMGEEWGETRPFLFFCDFRGKLADAVRKGRREEFSRFPEFADPERAAKIPDPLAEATFLASKLDWSRIDVGHLAYYRELLDTRREYVRPLLPSIEHGGDALVLGEQAVRVTWRAGDSLLLLDANLSPHRVESPPVGGRVFWRCGDTDVALGPWSVRWAIEPS